MRTPIRYRLRPGVPVPYPVDGEYSLVQSSLIETDLHGHVCWDGVNVSGTPIAKTLLALADAGVLVPV